MRGGLRTTSVANVKRASVGGMHMTRRGLINRGIYPSIFVLHLALKIAYSFFFQGFPGELRKLLESDLVLKVGLNIQG